MSRILILTTGGTLAAADSDKGLSPGMHSRDILKRIAGLTDGFDVEEEEMFMLDSSNMQPEEWSQLAARIYEQRIKYDGIVVIHGTDTLAYTASALSFALQDIEIPVVLTGSQVPIANPIADATENCRGALHMAASGCPGIYVAFNRRIITGTRASKVRTRSFDAFESIDYPYAARINSSGLVVNPSFADRKKGPCVLQNRFCIDVFLLKLFPGISPDIFDRLKDLGIRGVYVEAFGIGGLPFERRNMAAAVRRAADAGMIVAVGSQCLYEGSDFTVYEVGRQVLGSGVVETGNMTTEAAVTKLMWALGQYEDRDRVVKIMETNLQGELGTTIDWNKV
ncbi:MAG TPA: asparaginase [Candidatus Choladousia intestinipullorum]|nr:asparaginase [Candidatus Choladousia intestinipullorum]